MKTKKIIVLCIILAAASLGVYAVLSYAMPAKESVLIESTPTAPATAGAAEGEQEESIPLHIEKPVHVKAVYMSSWVAGTTNFRNSLTKLIEDTEINSIVIDFKDSSGVVSLPAPTSASLARKQAASKRAPNLPEYIKELHAKDIYVIARIAVFEDPVYAKNHPSEAVQNAFGGLWTDRHGLAWVDAGSTDFHEYILELALEAHAMGFDEINFDYIRFPTDGAGVKIYPISKNSPKKEVIHTFLSYIYSHLNSKNIPVSIDIFGQVVTATDDMNIGQQYEDLLSVTDAISPMVYPSHFYPGYKNLKSPELSPYETIRLSLADALRRRDAMGQATEIRPWIQDFSLAVPYGKAEVEAQIRAAKELGIESWMLWSPRNKYTKEALLPELVN